MNQTVALVLGVAALAAAALGRVRRLRVLRALQGAMALLGTAAIAWWVVEVGDLPGRWEQWAGVAVLLAIGYLLARVALLAIFEWLLAQRVGVRVPRLVRDVAALVLYLLVAATVLRNALNMDVGALLATSAVITVVIGLALQETLGTLIGGLALAWEQRVTAGEWVEIDGNMGQVEELGWRTLSLRTRLGEQILIPNSQVVRSRIRLLGHGSTPGAVVVRLGVAYGASPFAVKAVLRRVAVDIPDTVAEPGPQVLTHDFADNAITYEVRLWSREPWRGADLRDAFLTRAHAALAREGMEVPFPQRTVHVARPIKAPDRLGRCLGLLAQCEIFGGLPDDALADVATGSRLLEFAPGETVVREGEASQALYVVAEGTAVVLRGDEEIGRIAPGEVFGEMAFLLGVPRAATVRAAGALVAVEVDAHALRLLLRDHAGVAEELARRVAERQQAFAEREALRGVQPTQKGFASILLERLYRLVAG
ncbi:MAG: cyclic nucleotide-binding domain-containing protein [Acidobacteriota bacterium]